MNERVDQVYEEILRAAGALFQPGDTIEIRVPKAGKQRTISGYFQDLAKLAQAAAQLERSKYPGVYWTLNPVNPDLLGRANHRVKPFANEATSDSDIVRRRWLPVDLDPKRPTGISSSEAEHTAALALAERMRLELSAEGWGAAILADSGNGAHLLYRIDLPNDAASAELLRGVLAGLGARFDGGGIEVDRTTFNAARIFKTYGTTARKGDATAERPHRASRILEMPAALECVPVEVLQRIAVSAPVKGKERPSAPRRLGPANFDVEQFLGKHGLRHRPPVAWEGGWKYVLEACPFDGTHEAPDAAVFEGADGRLGFHCFHNSCTGRDWSELRELLEPGYRRAKNFGPMEIPPPADVRDSDAESPLCPADIEAAVAEAMGRDDLVGCMVLAPEIAKLPEYQRVLIKTKLRVKFEKKFSARDFDQAMKDLAAKREEPPADLADEDDMPDAPSLLGYPLTDSGNGERLIALHGRDIRYCIEFKKWLVWDGHRWKVDEADHFISQKAKDVARVLHRQAAGLDNTGLRDALQAHARASESQAAIAAAMKRAASEPGCEVLANELDQHPYLLNCLNGVVDVRSGQLLPADRSFLITKLCHVRFQADAKCPRFLKFLHWAMGENADGEARESVAHLVAFLQKAFGYALTGAVTEKVILIFYGKSGNNGKTTLLNVFSQILSEYSVQLNINTLMQGKATDNNVRADLAKLRGTRLAITSEVDEQQKFSERLLKDLTGMGTVTACKKFENPIEFPPTHKLVMDCNYLPVVRGADKAIWSRLRAVPFLVRMEEDDPAMDKDLKLKLVAEAEGILAWAVRGAIRWWKEKRLGEPPEVKETNTQWQGSMDPLKDFLEDYFELGSSEDGYYVQAKQLSLAYAVWCKEAGEKFRLSREQLGERMELKGFKYSRSRRSPDDKQMRTWEGLKLRDDVTLSLDGPGGMRSEPIHF